MSARVSLPLCIRSLIADVVPLARLAHLIVELTGARSTIVHRPLPVDDPIQRCPDISQARRVLDWEPQTPLRPGLQRTIAFFDKLLAERGETRKRKVAAA